MADSSPRVHTPFHFDFRRSTGATILFMLGVALTFAPLLLLTVTTARPPGPPAVAFWFTVSGGCAVLWALAGTTDRRLFFAAIPAQALASMAIPATWLGPFTLGASSTNGLGVLSVLCIGAGYACFVIFIVVHGRRAVAMSVEMSLAARIHRHLVPEIDLASDHFRVAARSEASGVMGGDVVHAALLPDGSIEAIVADVSGHGVRAGVVMAMVRATLESHRARRGAERGGELVESMASELNRVLTALTEPDMFVTAAIVHVDRDGAFEALVAAHPPLLLRRDGPGAPGGPGAAGVTETLGGAGMPLGVMEELDASRSSGHLGPGDELVLYSDGLTETRVASGRAEGGDAGARGRAAASMLGVDGLERFVAGMPAEPTRAVDGVLRQVAQASISAEPEDDRSILVIRRVGGRAPAPGGDR